MYSKILISGRLVEPADDKPRSGVTLTLHSVKNSSVVLKHATYRCVTGGNGEYSFNAAPGTYAVAVSVYGAEPERVGQICVYSDSLPGDLNAFLMAPSEGELTPEIIRLVDSMRSEAVKAAEAAAGYARQAQEAAQATAGALIDGGAADLSAGVYPKPVQVSGTARPTFWKVTKGGTVGDVDYGVGDTLIYTVAESGSYYKIDNTESVTSVQGEKGAVTLTPEKINATPMGKVKFAGNTSGLNWNLLGDDYSTPGGQKSGLLAFQYDDGNKTGPNSPFGDTASSGYGVAVCLSANLFSLQVVFCDNGDISFRTSYNGNPNTWTKVYGSKNTTVDSNGFIKRASPIARLYGNETSAKRDSEYVVSGCAAVNHEAEGVYAVREAVGLYRVVGCLGFATDGWYIETPADANGNKLLFVEYEQCSNGDIFIKTFTPDYSSGRCAAGEPKDIPDGRWIDLRLSMPEIAEL